MIRKHRITLLMFALVIALCCLSGCAKEAAQPKATAAPTATPAPLMIPLTSSNIEDFVDISAEFSGFSRSYSSSIYFADATLEVDCDPTEDVIFHDASFSLDFSWATDSYWDDLCDWDIPTVRISLSQRGRGSKSADCSYVSVLQKASSPSAHGNYRITNVKGTVEVRYGNPFYDTAKNLYCTSSNEATDGVVIAPTSTPAVN